MRNFGSTEQSFRKSITIFV